MAEAILVPHDGHSMSDIAVKYAIDIAKSMNLKIRLVRVIPELFDVSTMSHWNNAQRRRVKKAIEEEKSKTRKREYKKLQKQISLINSQGVETSSLVIEGVDVADAIADMIRKEKPYIVIIGSKKLKSKGFAKIKILGSVARKLSLESTRPLMIVK